MNAILKRPQDLKAFRISEGDTNYLACLADPIGEGVGFTAVVEIYDVGGRTPPNSHATAHEMFFILEGQGRAHSDGASAPIGTGDMVLLPPGSVHVIENTGPGKLYALCVMVPDEAFAALIRSGTPVPLDPADVAVLTRAAAGSPA